MFHTLQSPLENGQEARSVQVDFRASFDRVNHQAILYELCSLIIGGSVVEVVVVAGAATAAAQTVGFISSKKSGLLFVQNCIVHGIDDCYQLARAFSGFSS